MSRGPHGSIETARRARARGPSSSTIRSSGASSTRSSSRPGRRLLRLDHQQHRVNLAAQNKTTGFDFLWKTAGFDISFTLFPFDRTSFYWEAFLVGLTNTLLVAVIGIVFATILGFILGIARLSTTGSSSRLATVYVEMIRNIPLLLQLFFWYFAVLKAMPAVAQSFDRRAVRHLHQPARPLRARPLLDDAVHLGRASPSSSPSSPSIVHRAAGPSAGSRRPASASRCSCTSLAIIVVLPAGRLAASAARSVAFESAGAPAASTSRGGFAAAARVRGAGLRPRRSTPPPSSPRPCAPASRRSATARPRRRSRSGLKEGDRLRLVIIPQAMRVIIPPLTSQYLNLTKNSSLGAAIGYPELVNVFAGTALNQTGRAIEIIAMTMAVYLTFSLLTSAIMNWYNARVALVER